MLSISKGSACYSRLRLVSRRLIEIYTSQDLLHLDFLHLWLSVFFLERSATYAIVLNMRRPCDYVILEATTSCIIYTGTLILVLADWGVSLVTSHCHLEHLIKSGIYISWVSLSLEHVVWHVQIRIWILLIVHHCTIIKRILL